MYIIKTPIIIQALFRGIMWRRNKSKKVYLTFDDGPIPEATPWVLEFLKKEDIKATFFCVGENVKKHSNIYQQIIADGHQVGNHTYNHLNGWKTNKKDYLENIDKAANFIDSKLFRPPYGRVSPTTLLALKKRYKIVMWDVLSGDFDSEISAQECIANVTNNTESGSIIVFHDSIKSIKKLKVVLPVVVQYFKDNNIEMDRLDL
ncbi:MAG: polysaccharide deacetylase family protein [Saprospiraceae bacterium]